MCAKLSNLMPGPDLIADANLPLKKSLALLNSNSVEYLQWNNWNADMINDPNFLAT